MSYILINGYKIEMNEDIPFPVDFSIADITEPNKRSRSKSRTFTIVGTANNLQFFNSCYSLTLVTIDNQITAFNYDATAIYTAQYYRDEAMLFSGCFQVIRAKINKGVIEFECLLFDNVVNLFTEWGDAYISELGWSEYDHALTHSIIAASWDTYVVKNGSNTNNFTGGVPDGFGYIYPLIDYGYNAANINSFADNDIFPHFYVKEIIEKAFARLGYTLTGNWIDSEKVKRLLLGFGGGNKFTIDAATISDRRVLLEADLDYTDNYQQGQELPGGVQKSFVYNRTFIMANIAPAAIISETDVDLQYDATDGSLIVANNGTYNVRMHGSITYSFSLSASGDKFIQSGVNIITLVDGVPVLGAGTGLMDGAASGTFTYDTNIDIPLLAGQEITYRIDVASTAIIQPTTPYNYGALVVDIDNSRDGNFDLVQIDAELVNGDTVKVAQYMPKIKIKDFISGVINHFNLYLSEPTTAGEVRLEPLSDYYLNTNTFDDWTHKVDYLKEFVIESTAINQPKQYLYKFAPDADYYRANYQDKFGTPYGDRVVDNSALYTTGQSVIQLPYSVSVPVDSEINDRIIARIIKLENNSVSPYAGKPRMSVYIGKPSCDNWTLRHTDGGSDTVYNVYPLTHHIDDLTTPTFDILFSVPTELQYTATAYTTNNAYISAHDNFVRELLNRDGKMVKAYIRLNVNDINGEFFRKAKMIDGVLYRLNVIKDYNLNKDDSYYCELIRILNARSGRTFEITIGAIPLDGYVNDMQFDPIAVPPPSDSGKYRLTVDSGGRLKVTDDSGQTKNASDGSSYEFWGTLSQIGSAAPIVTVSYNTIPSGGSWARSRTGAYRYVQSGLLAGKTLVGSVTNGDLSSGSAYTFELSKEDDDTILLKTYSNGTLADGILNGASVFFKIF